VEQREVVVLGCRSKSTTAVLFGSLATVGCVRSEPYVGVPVTSGKPADEGRLGTSIPKFKPVSPYFTWRTRQDSGAANTESTALNIHFVLEFSFGQ